MVMVVVVECTWYSGCTCMVCIVVVAGGGSMRWLYVRTWYSELDCTYIIMMQMVVAASHRLFNSLQFSTPYKLN